VKPLSNGEFFETEEHYGFALDYDTAMFKDNGSTWQSDFDLHPDVLAWLAVHAGPRLKDETWHSEDNGWMMDEVSTTGISIPYLWFKSRLIAAHFKLVWL
jgi:hypothetical protein